MTGDSKIGWAGDRKNRFALAFLLLREFLAEVEFCADGIAGKMAFGEDFFAAEVGGFDYASQDFAEVGRNFVAVVEAGFGDEEFRFGIEDDEVGVVAGGEAAFAGVGAGEFRRGGGHPAGDVGE